MLFLSADFLFENGFDKLPWIAFISILRTKLRIIIRGVPGLATDYPYVFRAVDEFIAPVL